MPVYLPPSAPSRLLFGQPEVDLAVESEEDLYATVKGLQRAQEFLDIQEEYIKDEMKNLKRELI